MRDPISRKWAGKWKRKKHLASTQMCAHMHTYGHVHMNAIHLQIGNQLDKFMHNHICTHINTCIHMPLGRMGSFLSDPWVLTRSNNNFCYPWLKSKPSLGQWYPTSAPPPTYKNRIHLVIVNGNQYLIPSMFVSKSVLASCSWGTSTFRGKDMEVIVYQRETSVML